MFKRFSSQNFLQKNLAKTVFSFRENLPCLFFDSLPLKKSIFANKHLFYQFHRFVSLSLLKNSSIFSKWISFDFLCFSFLQVFLPSFFHHFLFLFITFRFHLFFHFLLCLIFDFLHLPSSWTQFFWTAISLLKKNSSTYPFFMHALPLYDHLLIDLFICCLFFSLRVFPFLTHVCFPFPSFVFSVHNFSERKVYGTAANLKKCLSVSLSLFVGHLFHIYLSLHKDLWRTRLHIQWEFVLFVLVLECFSLYCSHFTYLFSLDPVWFWSSFFSSFSFSPVKYFPSFTQRHVFVLFPFVLSLSFFEKTCVSCLLVLSKVRRFTFFQNKNYSVGKTSCVLVYRSLFSFSFICFSCRFLFDVFLISFATCFFLKKKCLV